MSKGEVMLATIFDSASDDGMADENPVGGGSDPTKSKGRRREGEFFQG